MNIKEIISEKLVGEKFILNKNFKLGDSFDSGTILFIDSIYQEEPYDRSYAVNIRIVNDDFIHNYLISTKDWYNKIGEPVLNIYQSLYLNYYKGDQLIKQIESPIYVMEDDDCFDLDLSYIRNKKLNELGI